MPISLSAETQKLIEERMKQGEYANADDVIRVALETLEQCESGELSNETWAAIDRAEAQYERGEGIPASEAFAKLRRKHFGE